MVNTTKLERAYKAFINHKLDKLTGTRLVAALDEVGLKIEASGIQHYLDAGDKTSFKINDGIWQGKICYVGTDTPTTSDAGSLWLDVVDLNLMLMQAPLETEVGGITYWISVHPIFNWQFYAFVDMLQWKKQPHVELSAVGDLFDASQYSPSNGLNFVKDIFFYEAQAYAKWYGKMLANQGNYITTQASLTEKQFEQILPKDMRAWDGDDYLPDESAKMTVGHDNLNRSRGSLEYELDLLDKTVDNPDFKLPKDMVLYDQWEKTDEIGFSITYVNKPIYHYDLPLKVDDLLLLENKAFRP